ncbi:hypothetical protein [Ectopseudomonas oleovorans]|uniref:hypothetical protein n=1 Tax=Ectopseudomonas oleovorans TaxID=301 RepID=UPI001F5C052F|nr:hypothetical protein [Pseudomonas oleovorans]
MPARHLLPCLLLAVSTLAQANDQDNSTVRLDTSLEDPYQLVVDGELSGSSVTVLECIFNRLQRPYQIQLTSLSRARQNVSTRIADVFFSSAPDSQVDGYAHLSAPLLMEILVRPGSADPQQADLGPRAAHRQGAGKQQHVAASP